MIQIVAAFIAGGVAGVFIMGILVVAADSERRAREMAELHRSHREGLRLIQDDDHES